MTPGCYAVGAVGGITSGGGGCDGMEGTTYEIGYDRVRKLLGDGVTGRIFLDFGCGAGRSTAFLRALGARRVHGVDHDQNMIYLALAIK